MIRLEDHTVAAVLLMKVIFKAEKNKERKKNAPLLRNIPAIVSNLRPSCLGWKEREEKIIKS